MSYNMLTVRKRAAALVGHTVKVGECQKITRTLFGSGPTGGTAADAWNNAKLRVRVSDARKIPAGAEVYYLGGASGHACVKEAALGDPDVWTSDLPRSGSYGVYDGNQISSRWPGHTLVGYVLIAGNGDDYRVPMRVQPQGKDKAHAEVWAWKTIKGRKKFVPVGKLKVGAVVKSDLTVATFRAGLRNLRFRRVVTDSGHFLYLLNTELAVA